MFSLSQRFRLQIGDVVLLCSDGVFEARSPGGEYFGAQRALNVVREHLDDDASRIVEHLHSAAVAFAGGAALDDDHTIVVVKVVPTGGSNRETWTA
jgi:sigma-B regulation protein RsbU (phosphoserine phosphatase)